MNIFHQIREWFSGTRVPPLVANADKAERGRHGEDLAADYYKHTMKCRVLARNWRYKRDEVDLICLDGAVLVFVEVRARSETAKVSGYHSVDKRKKDTLRRAYKNYLRQLRNPPKHFRFDIIDVSISLDGESSLKHYPNVSLFHKHFSVQKP